MSPLTFDYFSDTIKFPRKKEKETDTEKFSILNNVRENR